MKQLGKFKQDSEITELLSTKSVRNRLFDWHRLTEDRKTSVSMLQDMLKDKAIQRQNTKLKDGRWKLKDIYWKT